MRLYHTAVTFITLILFSPCSIAQEMPEIKNPPVSIEAFAGNRALGYQMNFSKKLQSISGLGWFSVMNLQPEWGYPEMNDYMLQGKLTYSIVKGLDIAGGFIWVPIDGIRPSAAIMYSYGSPGLVIIVNPRIDLTKNANFDTMGLVEYKPKVNDKINLYSRIQGLLTRNLGYDQHARSYLMFRAGLTFKDVSFGAASNFDWYGPLKHHEKNFGAFVLFNLF